MRIFVFFLAVVGACSVLGQKIDTVYFDKDWKEASETSVSYFRVYTQQSEGWSSRTFFRDGILQEEAFVRGRNPDVKDGERKRYYENGQLEIHDFFSEGKSTGVYKSFFENGQQEMDAYFIEGKKQYNQIWDEAGNSLLVEGTGITKSALKNGDESVNAYLKYSFDCSYQIRKVNGDTLYNIADKLPEYKGGFEAFYRRIGSLLKYPTLARRNGTQGRVYVQIIVSENGNLEEVKVVKGIGSGCDEETTRVIKLATDWTPAEHHGVHVKAIMILPVYFKLSN